MGAILAYSFMNPSSIECFEAFLAVGIKLTPIGIDNPLSIEMGREILPLFLRLWWHLPVRKFLLSTPIFDSYGQGKSQKKKKIWNLIDNGCIPLTLGQEFDLVSSGSLKFYQPAWSESILSLFWEMRKNPKLKLCRLSQFINLIN